MGAETRLQCTVRPKPRPLAAAMAVAEVGTVRSYTGLCASYRLFDTWSRPRLQAIKENFPKAEQQAVTGGERPEAMRVMAASLNVFQHSPPRLVTQTAVC